MDKERADKEGWWYKPEYLFNDLNINSAIASPAESDHDPAHSHALHVIAGASKELYPALYRAFGTRLYTSPLSHGKAHTDRIPPLSPFNSETWLSQLPNHL